MSGVKESGRRGARPSQAIDRSTHLIIAARAGRDPRSVRRAIEAPTTVRPLVLDAVRRAARELGIALPGVDQ